MDDKKFSQFTVGGDIQRGDIVVGLRSGANFQFDFPGLGIKDANGNYMFQYATMGAAAVNFPVLTNALTGGYVLYGANGADSDIPIWVRPAGSAGLRLDDLNWPLSDGPAGSAIVTDGSGNLSFTASPPVLGIIGTTRQVLANGTFGIPQGGTVTLTTPQDIAPISNVTFNSLTLTVPLTMANGGTNKALVAANGGIVYTDAASMEILAPTATARQMLQSGASSAPAWSSAAWPATTTINQLLYSSAANTVNGLATANSAILFTNATGVPAWSASMTNGQVMIGSTGASPIPATLTAGTAINITNAANSITISSTGASGIIGTANQVLANGTSGSTQTGTVTLTTPQNIAPASSPTFNALTLTNPLTVINGGTGVNAFLANQILFAPTSSTIGQIASVNSATLVTNSIGVPAMTSSMTNGQIVIGSTGATPAAATITAGPGVSIANGANSITISAVGGGIGWTEVTGTTQTMAADSAYVSSNAGLVTLTLPLTAAFGSQLIVVGKGAGGWLIAQNAGQNIQVGTTSSTVGAAGSVASTNRFNSITLVCTTANTTWTTLGAPQSAGLTIV